MFVILIADDWQLNPQFYQNEYGIEVAVFATVIIVNNNAFIIAPNQMLPVFL